jgi:alpha-beta hydrolase superfamily lysophospholipase
VEEIWINLPSGEKLFSREWLPESKPKGAICIIHGLSDHSGRFTFLAEALSQQGFIFLAPDLRGNGKSPGSRGHFDSIEQVMNDISSVIDFIRKEHPDLPVFLYGQSMGGNLAISYALSFPDKINGAVSSSPWLRLAKPPAGIVRMLASALRPLFPALLLPNGIKSSDLCHDEIISQAYDNDPLIHWKVSLNTFFIIQVLGERAVENAGQLQVPLLLMHGNADKITSFNASVQFAEKAGDNCTFIRWEGQYHELHNEFVRNEVIGKVIFWLNEQLKNPVQKTE